MLTATRDRLRRLRRATQSGVVALLDRVRPGTVDLRLARIERAAGGRLHVAATNLADGRTVELHGHDHAPLASTVKLALAVEVLARADAGLVPLGAPVTVSAEDGVFGEGALDVRFRDAAAPVTRTVAELLRLSLVESDNTATDRLFALVGGPPAVQRRVERLGVRGMRVDRTIGEMFADRRALRAHAGDDLPAASRAFLADPRDTTTAAAMVALLAAIHAGAGLSAASAAHLVSLMGACATSATRIRAGVPRGATVAHKTGTLQREVTADVGLVTLRGGATVALAIYIVGSVVPGEVRSRAIARATRIALAAIS